MTFLLTTSSISSKCFADFFAKKTYKIKFYLIPIFHDIQKFYVFPIFLLGQMNIKVDIDQIKMLFIYGFKVNLLK